MGGVPAMDEIFTVLDIIRDSDRGGVYLIRHKVKEVLLVAKTFRSMSEGIKTARLLMNLRQDNIAAVQGVSGNGDFHIVVMEYLPGGNLADRMVMPMPHREAMRIMRSVCRALQFAHTNRITHGNLKPENVLFTATDAVKVADFRMNGDRDGGENGDLSGRIREDILACGRLLYAMVLGYPPVFDGGKFIPHKQFKILPKDVRLIVLRLFSEDEDTRFRSMKHAADSIDRYIGEEHGGDKTVVGLDSGLTDSLGHGGDRRNIYRKAAIIAGIFISVAVTAVLLVIFL
jgi:serine/threonine-protein kinase